MTGPAGPGPGANRVRTGRLRRRLPVVALAAILAFPATFARPALAHGGGSGLHATWLPFAVFLFGVTVLAACVALDHREAVDRRTADAGVLLGVGCVLAAIGIFWV